jgi:predicted branched-subunit amino acid permease
MHRGLGARLVAGYLTGDLNYVLFTRRFAHPATDAASLAEQDAYWLGLAVVGWAAWVVPSLAGIALGNVVSPAWGLGFAGILALIGMTCSLVTTRLRAVSAGVSAMAAVAALALPFRLHIVTAIAVAVATCLLLEAPLDARRG